MAASRAPLACGSLKCRRFRGFVVAVAAGYCRRRGGLLPLSRQVSAAEAAGYMVKGLLCEIAMRPLEEGRCDFIIIQPRKGRE